MEMAVMAVKSLMKSSGWAALAVGIAAMALPAAASAQDGHQTISKSEFLQQHQAARQEQRQVRQEQRQVRQEQRQVRPEQRQVRQEQRAMRQSNAGNWQGRGNGEARGNGGNWQGRGDGGWRGGNWSPGRPQAQSPVENAPRQVRRPWNRGDNAPVVQNNERRADHIRNRLDGDRTRWDGHRSHRAGDGIRITKDEWLATERPERVRRDRDNRHWDGDRRHRWSHDWRRDNRYNWYQYRNHNRHVFRLGHYYSPYRNWSYRRLHIGFSLQPLFYSSNYWIDDPWRYRLPEVYGPYRWVRYYDDALLVDVYSGEVVDVIYDFFW
jgi:hypothetical protein